MIDDLRSAGSNLGDRREPQNGSLVPPVTGPRSRTVLVIDDDAQIRSLASRVLVDEGFGVMTAGDGAEGLAMFRRYRSAIGVVLLDMAMPEMNGAQFIRALRVVDTEARILLSSGHDIEPLLQAEGVWPSAFLPKPYRPSALVAAIEGLLSV